MVSQKFVAAMASFSLLTGGGASPCHPSSSLSISGVATSTLVSVIESSTATSVFSTAASSTETATTETVATGAASTTVSTTTESSSIPEPTSYLLNGNFDTNPATFSPWALWYSDGMTSSGASLNLDYTRSHRGPRSLRISPGTQSTTYLAQTVDKTSVRPDAKYEFSVWLQISSAAQCVQGASITKVDDAQHIELSSRSEKAILGYC
ncbi:hypothetical protein ACJZ2D_008282 [Fusarium nematophilum]